MTADLQYRFARADEIPAAARLVAHSFPGRTPASLEERLAHPVYGGGPETLLVGTDARGIAGACQVHPLRQWIAGAALPVTGIGTVAIAPTHRRRRLAASLVTAALHAGRERGDIGSSLYPFRVAFYRRLGYGLAGEAIQHVVPPATLPDAVERQHVEMLEESDARDAAFAVYGRWVQEQTGQLDRTREMWLRLFDEIDRALVGYRGISGDIEGYALAIHRTDLMPRVLEVDELIWTTAEARRGLYGWLASMGDQWTHIMLRSLPSHRVTDWLSEPRLPSGSAVSWRLWAPSATLMSGPMFRLLDVRAAFEGRRIAQAPTITMGIDVRDEQITANTGSWRVALDVGRATIEKARTADITLRLDISTLSRIFIGALPPTAALAAGLLECDRAELLPILDTALALPEPWTFDRF